MSTPQQQLSPGKMKILKAVAVLMEDPVNKITINRIAGEVSVTEAAIYRHYKSKQDIFGALMMYLESNFMGPMNHVQNNAKDAYHRLRFLFDTYIDFLDGHPGLARLLLGHASTEAPGVSEQVTLLNAKVRGQLGQILRWGEAKDELQPGVTPEQGAEVFYGLILAAAMCLVCEMPELDRESRWQVFANAVLAPRH